MKQIIAIALGGSAGAVMRYLVANAIYAWLGRGFPHGTLFVNVSGSFLMGILTELMLQRLALSVEYRAAILVGFLGAYTTFSTFAIETLALCEEGEFAKAAVNIILSTTLCLVAVWYGLVLGRRLFSDTLFPWFGHDFPYAILLQGLGAMFLLAVAIEWAGQATSLEPVYRAMALMTVLGALAVLYSVWATSKLSAVPLAFHGSLSIFAINAVFGVLVVWFGALTGQWLWQISRSQ